MSQVCASASTSRERNALVPCLLKASLEVIIERHGVWWLMPDSKFPFPSQPAQVSGSRAWNNDQCDRRYSFFECADVLKHKAPRATTNAAHHAFQTDEAGRAVVAVHH